MVKSTPQYDDFLRFKFLNYGVVGEIKHGRGNANNNCLLCLISVFEIVRNLVQRDYRWFESGLICRICLCVRHAYLYENIFDIYIPSAILLAMNRIREVPSESK